MDGKIETGKGILYILENHGINIAFIIAGLLGAFVSTGSKKLNFWGYAVVILSGGIIANYVTPIIGEYVTVKPNIQNGFAFMVGFAGLEGMKWLILTFQKKFGKKIISDEHE